METLVAIALLALAIIPLYSFQQTLADSAARLQGAAAALEAEESALAYLQAIDPIAEPEGEFLLGEWRLSWSSREIASEAPANGYLGSSYYRISLVEISAKLEKDSLERTFILRRVAWVQIIDPFSF